MRETWGHLDPPPGTYPGWILFAHGTHGDLVVLDEDFTDGCGGPWFYDELLEFTGQQSEQEEGVYRFVGTYTRFKNGKGRFRGKVTHTPLATLIPLSDTVL